MRSIAIVAAVLCVTGLAAAEPIRGRVVDRTSGVPVEGAVVFVTGADGFERTLSSGEDGSYSIDVPPGTYRVTFLHGTSKVGGQVVVQDGAPTTLNGRVDYAPETITLEHTRAPAVMPQPRNAADLIRRAPPYSDAAIEHDAWVRAWLLLDVDEQGTVTRLKVLNHPGFDLEPIAIREGFRMSFTPGRDDKGRAVRTAVVWPIEWVANSWLLQFGTGVRTRMPELSRTTGNNSARYVACKQDGGPWNMTALYRGYRDCARPNWKAAETEPWILPSD